MSINIIGLGYIGLPTALMFASAGNEVVGTDIDHERVDKLKEGQIPFEEKGMEDLMALALENDIVFSNESIETDIYIVTVPSPYVEETKKVDASYIESAVKNLLNYAQDDAIIVIESTVSPGTIDQNVRPIINNKMKETGKTFHLVHAPERILPGNMVNELKYNARTVGCDDVSIGNKIKAIYETFCESEIVITDIKSAEMSKVVENTYRDVNIAFANELLKICDKEGLDVYEVISIANRHPRVNILNPGPGVGGHCIPVDPWFLVGDYPDDTQLIGSARQINDSMPSFTLEKIHHLMAEHDIKDISRVGLYGLSYKANVDDIRESPTLQLLDRMDNESAKQVKVYDPLVSTQVIDNQMNDFEEFVSEIDLIVIMVGHQHIIESFDKISSKAILDTQHIIDNHEKIHYLVNYEK